MSQHENDKKSQNNNFCNFSENYCKTLTERVTTKVIFSQTIQQQTMRVFVMYVKILERDEIAAFLHSCLPDPLGEGGFIFCVLSTKYEKYEIYRPLLSQSNFSYFSRQ